MLSAIIITLWLTWALLIIIFLISFKGRGKNDLLLLHIYIAVSIVVYTINNIVPIFFKTNMIIIPITQNIFSLIEILLINLFFYLRIQRKIMKKFTIILLSIYYLFCAALWISYATAFRSFTPPLFGLEGICIAIPSLFYLFEILHSDLHTSLASDAYFISTCGILLFFSITIPIWFILSTFYVSNELFGYSSLLTLAILNLIFYLSLLKAFLCMNRKHL
jgi:hypothetical protein